MERSTSCTRDDFSRAWTARAAQSGRQLFFFCPDVTDASTLKRVQQFIDHGYGVTVFGFRRERYNIGYQPAWPHVPLGLTTDGKLRHRMPRPARRPADDLRPPLPVQGRVGVLCPQHRSAAARHVGATARAGEGADRLRGARHPADPDAPRPGSHAAARHRAVLPAPREGAGAVFARIPSRLLRSGPEIPRSLVPAREQAASFDRQHRPAGAADPFAAKPAAVGGRLFRPDPRRADVRADDTARRKACKAASSSRSAAC